eukprot:358864-Chlamydomonas_euryale.AAC.5
MEVIASGKDCVKSKVQSVCVWTHLPIFWFTWTWTEVQMGRLEVTHSKCLRGIVGMKLMDRHRLETIQVRKQCGTSSLELMARTRTIPWMGHVLRMDEDRLPRQVFYCALARSVAEDGRVEQLQ